jgi:hypothetical protein
MTQSLTLQPEFFALVGIGVFLALSLLTYLLEGRFPKKLPYIYQIGAFLGFLCLLVSRFVFFGVDGSVRLWYCYGYLIAALANIIGTNVCLVFPKRQFTTSKIWSFAVTLPLVFAAALFVTEYGFGQTMIWPLIEQAGMFAFVVALDTVTGILFAMRIRSRLPSSHAKEVIY